MYQAVAANKRNTLLIMLIFVGLVGAIGWVFGVLNGNSYLSIIVIIVAAIYALVQYFLASKLAVMSTGAREIAKADDPRLYRIIENLAITTGIPTPKVYVIDDPAPNAFATGRDPEHALVAATTGLMEIMNDRELAAVMAHEMGHVKNYDIRVSMITFGLVSAIGLLSDFALRMFFWGGNDDDDVPPAFAIIGGLLIFLSPFIAMLIQMAISRQREFLADATGALTTRDSEGLASALEKIAKFSRPLKRQSTTAAHLFFANPLKSGSIAAMFSTHPPLEMRIARLRENQDRM